MTQHTPSPYCSFRGVRKHREAIFIKGGNVFVAKIYGHDGQPVEENARLFVAAPDLNLYRWYIERNMQRMDRDGWIPIGFEEYLHSEEIENDRAAFAETDALSSPEIDATTVQGAAAPVKSEAPTPTTKGDLND